MPAPSPVLVAPDSFKGTFTAREVADALGRGLARAGVASDLQPVADGGEGTLDVLAAALGAELRTAEVHDPLGRPLRASYAMNAAHGVAIVETAAACGLGLVAPEERDAWAASSAGAGELIAAAVRAGARTVLVSIGGSATSDGGAGALAALEAAGGIGTARVEVLCDVETPFELAAELYAPQKGADAETVAALTARLHAVAGRLPRDPRGVAMTGGAGGLAGALWAACGATLAPGAARVLDAVGFDVRLRAAAAVVTGEGALDRQTLQGKLVGEIGRRTRAVRVPLYAVVGRDALPVEERATLGLSDVLEATTLAEIEAAGMALGRRLRATG
ncbi:MAG: glycerate kinase [Actinobacteria bacterium]|nr:glycerate kinase [Actinomycetota bacterium]